MLSRPQLRCVAGFGYHFDSLNRSENKLANAFSGMFSPSAVSKKPKPSAFFIQRIIGFLIRALPILNIAKWIPNERIQRVRQGFATLESESRTIIESKQGEVEKDGLESVRGSKDLIALLRKLLLFLCPSLSLLSSPCLSPSPSISMPPVIGELTEICSTVKSASTDAKAKMTAEELRGQLTVSSFTTGPL